MEQIIDNKNLTSDKEKWGRKIWKAVWGNSALMGLLIGVVSTVAVFIWKNIDPPAVKAKVEEIKTTMNTYKKEEDLKDSKRDEAIEALKTNQINTDKKIDDLKNDNKESFKEINGRLDALFLQKSQVYNGNIATRNK